MSKQKGFPVMLNLILPPMATLNDAAAELAAAAGDDRATANAVNKAIFYLGEGVVVRPTTGGFLIPSATRGIVHRVSNAYGCGCEAGTKAKPCWHAALIAIVEQAQTRALPMADRIAAARRVARERAEREMAELFS
jgi:hypothetical protein